MARLRLTLFGLDRALEHHQIDFLPFGHAALAVVQHYRKVLSEGNWGQIPIKQSMPEASAVSLRTDFREKTFDHVVFYQIYAIFCAIAMPAPN